MENRVTLTLIEGKAAYDVSYLEPMEPSRHLLRKYKPADEQQVRKEAEECFAGYDYIEWTN